MWDLGEIKFIIRKLKTYFSYFKTNLLSNEFSKSFALIIVRGPKEAQLLGDPCGLLKVLLTFLESYS